MSDKKTKGPDKKFSNKGFTLIEILIALAIFSIGILGVASMQILTVKYNLHARRATTGTSWGVERMESLMTLPYDDANLDPATNPHTDIRGDTIDEGEIEGTYNITWNVTDNVDNKIINMNVSWTVRGVTKNILLNYVKPQDI